MDLQFAKYQGTGNDFILLDDRREVFPKNDTKLVKQLCDRNFGIGADGLILLQHSEQAHFKMVYYNSDGELSSMCGNGGRCMARFAQSLGILDRSGVLEAVDGLHEVRLQDRVVAIRMKDVTRVEQHENHWFVDSGSPHHIELVDALQNYPVDKKGRAIRNELYGKEGANVNFVQQTDQTTFNVRTYERGVEGETLSCGTGVTAVALAMHASGRTAAGEVTLQTPGGTLAVAFSPVGNGYEEVWLKGPATHVFNATWSQ